MRRVIVSFMLIAASATAAERWYLEQPAEYTGMADASGAVAIDERFFVVADDESNILRLYSREHGGAPIREFDCNLFLHTIGKHNEADLEAGARIGERAFWIGSHGRNEDGKARPDRCRFFATDIKTNADGIRIVPVGRPYCDLLEDLCQAPALARFGLREASLLAPKARGALNIEGLGATPEGHLLIGFRNPVPDGKALLVPLLNPQEVIQTERARLGAPILLDLDGLGIRDIALHDNQYLIIAGSYHGGGRFELYQWAGGAAVPERIKVNHLNRYHPEAIIIYPDKGLRAVQLLSDDGTERIEGVPAHEVTDWSKRRFRSFWVSAKPR